MTDPDSDQIDAFSDDVWRILGNSVPGDDPLPNGTVVRWFEDHGRDDYAALRAAGRWYTTATQNNVLDYAELVRTLARPDVTSVTVAAFPESRSIK